ncbi:MAG: hypothetical protein LBR36_07930 [Bacteroidales bacterium]|jgi:hypothetical protein|nr:hypothetical protein [Bacteroidales bacterium]
MIIKLKRYLFIAILFLFVSQNAVSQTEIKPVKAVDSTMKLSIFLAPNYTYNFALADLKKDFGNNMSLGVDLCLKLPKNWTLDFGFKYFFEGSVDSSLSNATFKNRITSNGFFINGNGEETNEISLDFRGINFNLTAGKVFPVSKRFLNSGIWLRLGLGVTQHYLHIKNPENLVKALEGNYLKGYDHLTAGFTLNQFVGYLHLMQRSVLCFYAGVEFSEIFGRRQREYDFALMGKDTSKPFEVMIGIKVGWIIPLYRKTSAISYEFR